MPAELSRLRSPGEHRTSLGLRPNSAGSCFLEQVALLKSAIEREAVLLDSVGAPIVEDDSHSVKILSEQAVPETVRGSELQAWETQPS